MRIDYEKLYEFDENCELRGRGFRADPEAAFLENSHALLRGDERARTAIRFRHQMGKRVCDVIWTGHVACVLVSKAFRDLLKRKKFTGWGTYPVKVSDQEGKELRGYAGLAVSGRAGPLDNSRCKKVWRGPAFEGGPKWQNYVGMFFTDDQWDGSDFCTPEGRSSIIITQRVKDALAELKIPNVRFRRLSEHERDAGKLRPPLRIAK